MKQMGFGFTDQQSHLKHLLSLRKKGFLYEELHYLVARINYTMFIRYGIWSFSPDTCTWMYYFIEDKLSYKDIDVERYEENLSEAFIEVTLYEYRRWKYFSKYFNRFKELLRKWV